MHHVSVSENTQVTNF